MKKSRRKVNDDTPLNRAVARDDMAAAISILKDKSLCLILPGKNTHAGPTHSTSVPEFSQSAPVAELPTPIKVPEQASETVSSPTRRMSGADALGSANRRMSQVSALSANSGGSPDEKPTPKKKFQIFSPKLKVALPDENDTAMPTVDVTATSATHRTKMIRITAESVPVHSDPSLYSVLVCHLKQGVIVTTDTHLSHKPTYWVKISCGYIQSHDPQQVRVYQLSSITEASVFWVQEGNKRQRMASAVCSMLIRSYTLPNALRFARSMLKHAHSHYPLASKDMMPIVAASASAALTTTGRPKSPSGLFDDPANTPAALALVGSNPVTAELEAASNHKHSKQQVVPQLVVHSSYTIEDIMIALAGKVGLRKEKVFEYIKIAACSQSNPILCVLLVTEDIYNLLNVRPTLWTTNHLNILETESVRLSNDKFVMAAANGDVVQFKKCLLEGQELTNIHSELKYTALHAAADFGQAEIIRLIVGTGLSVNIRDPRKGYTALHFACANGRHEIAQLLLDLNANRKLTCSEGLKPYELADRWGHIECREITKFIVPVVRTVSLTDVSISSLSVSWEPPALSPVFHSPITEYVIECWPADVYPEGEAIDHEHEPLLNEHAVPLDYAHTLTVAAPQHQAHFPGLIPATVYKFTVKCRSLSGWCVFSQPVLFSTLACVPEKPPPMEVIKVTTNGLLLSWQPPMRNNGYPVDFYQIEILEAAQLKDRRSRPSTAGRPKTADKALRFESTAATSTAVEVSKSVDGALFAEKPPESPEEVQDDEDPQSENRISKSHRVLKHLGVNHRFRYLTGLEPYRPYVMRTRAYNKMGSSPWSNWCEPVAPMPGIKVLESGYNGQRMSTKVSWFQPVLSDGRTAQFYELQVCMLKGPQYKNITLLATRKDRDAKPRSPKKGSAESLASEPTETSAGERAKPEPQESNEFITLSDRIEVNEYEIGDLKAGGRYQCRVRCKVAEEEDFYPWDTAILSETFSISATAPDPPIHVRPVLVSGIAALEDNVSVGPSVDELGSVGSQVPAGEGGVVSLAGSLDMQSLSHVHPLYSNASIQHSHLSASEYPDDYKRDLYQVTHDSITLEWTSGNSNGARILEYCVEMAPIKPHRVEDVLSAVNADFRDVSSQGSFVGPAQFRVAGLTPGTAYLFRVKQRNACGWSRYSEVSDIMSTYSSTPPLQPQALRTASNYCILRWRDDDAVHDYISLTSLEHQVQLAVLLDETSATHIADDREDVLMIEVGPASSSSAKPVDRSLQWYPVQTATAVREHSVSLESASRDDFSSVHSLMHDASDPHATTVMVQRLVSGTTYVARARVRTVMGWSPWSPVSDSFRTTSN